jgi:hypothetical protein
MASFLEYTKNYTSPVNENMRTLGNFYKMAMIDKAMSMKTENPKMTKKDIAKSLDVSERTLQRYSNDINETMFQKKKVKTIFNPQKCEYCDFIAKNKSGVKAHERSKHLEEITNKKCVEKETTKIQKQTKSDRSKKKEKVGYGIMQCDTEFDVDKAIEDA